MFLISVVTEMLNDDLTPVQEERFFPNVERAKQYVDKCNKSNNYGLVRLVATYINNKPLND